MLELADRVYQLPGKPQNAINIYLIEDVLVDSGTPQAHKRIFQALGDRIPSGHLVTHAHPDHYGSSQAVCEKYGLSLMCGDKDAGAIEQGRPETTETFLGRQFMSRLPVPPPFPVGTRLKEGDKVGSFEVLDTPGHSPGHIALWRSADKTLVMGDVLFNLRLPTLKPGLAEPPKALTLDPAQNRDSARRLAELEPELVLFGHGPPLRNAEALTWFAAALPK
ncbi:MAG TPA: MBL fold metallo-hydrolase [Actinomycetota bacterium]|nr:MBL fold metallo-hydrolase [Actinomycetota bacterium]